MTDNSNKRSSKSFEPPPWEQEQFKELAQQRAEKEAETELNRAILDLETKEEQAPEAPEVIPPEAEDASCKEDIKKRDEEIPDTEGMTSPEFMLQQLSVDEPEDTALLGNIGLLASAIAATIGVVLVIWGMVGLGRAEELGKTATMGGSVLLLFGGGLVGFGGWAAIRSLKQRGVL